MPTVPVVYVDVVWLINFILDSVLLWLTGWILHRKMRLWRLTTAGFIGACYSVLLFVPPLTPLTTWAGKVVVSLIMVRLALARGNWLDLLRVTLLYYFISFVMAGAAIALRFALPGVSVAHGFVVNGRLAFETSGQSLALLVAVPCTAGLLQYALRKVREAKLRAGARVSVSLLFGAETVSFVGLVDSGNHVRDPISRRPVSFVDASVFLPLCPRLGEVAERPMESMHLLPPELLSKAVVVPFRGAGQGQSFCMGLRPDAIWLEMDGKTEKVAEPAIFALRSGQLSNDQSYQAILHMELVMGDEGFETKTHASADQSQDSNPPSTLNRSDSVEIPRST